MYKSIDVYLQYAVVALVFTAFALTASADVQINQQAKFSHVPFDNNDTDREIYVGSLPPNFNVQDGTQNVSIVATAGIDCSQLPPELAALEVGQRIDTEFVSAGLDDQCTITDVNGDTRQVDVWLSRFKREPTPVGNEDLGLCYFRVSLKCIE